MLDAEEERLEEEKELVEEEELLEAEADEDHEEEALVVATEPLPCP